MGKTSSNIGLALSRALKIAVVFFLVPLVIGLLRGVRQELDVAVIGQRTALYWVDVGALTYIWVHLLLWRPVPVFRVSREMFSTLATWLFGGQVSSVDEVQTGRRAPAPKKGRGDKDKDDGKQGGPAQPSTLVAFSPYVMPLYTVLVCAAGWVLARWIDAALIEQPAALLVGITLTFHWLMTADELQQQRKRWHLETYLLAIGLIFTLTVLIAAACLPLAVPAFSAGRALTEGWAQAQHVYRALVQGLFL
jgi:hypothetical protein